MTKRNPFMDKDEISEMKSSETGCEYTPEWFALQNRPIYFFGVGDYLSSITKHFADFAIKGFLDNDASKQGKQYDGCIILAPNTAAPVLKAENAVIVISTCKEHFIRQIEKQCRELGLHAISWGDCWLNFPNNFSPEERGLWENEKVINTFNIWDEERSKTIFRDLIRFRSTRNIRTRPEVTEISYFIPEIPTSCFSNFIDAGAYDGDTFRVYKSLLGDNFDNYYAFEPSPCHFGRLLAISGGNPKVHAWNKGVSNKSGKFTVNSIALCGGSAVESNKTEIEMITIDSAIGDKPVGMIKMDIEGAEMNALLGAETILKRDRPALAICIYHKISDLWEIPQWIRGLNLGYRLLVRHHSRATSETVCYAIP